MGGWIALALLFLVGTPLLALIALARTSGLNQRLARMEKELLQLRVGSIDARSSASVSDITDAHEPHVEAGVASASQPADAAHAAESVLPAAVATPSMSPPLLPMICEQQVAEPATGDAGNTAEPAPDFVATMLARVKRWFTIGNVPVKVGVLVLLVGVAALLRYASSEGWLNVPISLRLVGVAVAALLALALSWRQRERNRSFALAVQGGAIGVLLLVAFAACRLYALIDTAAAFGVSVVLTAGLAVLAVVQNSRTLAVLGVLAGFMAPIWLANGNGSHIALFAYYLAINLGIVAMVWTRPWRMLNLLGFAFTWGIAVVWGVLSYTPAKFASTEPFLLLFFALYLALPLLYARQTSTRNDLRVDACLLFGTPLIAFSLQAALLAGARIPLALNAVGLAAIYTTLAWCMRNRERFALLTRGYAVLGVGFATLAIPLALSAHATAATFALEGAGMVWLGLAQRRRLPCGFGLALQVAAAFALFVAKPSGAAVPVANAAFMGALLIAIAGLATAWLHHRSRQSRAAMLAYLWALAWWLGNALHEIGRFLSGVDTLLATLLTLALTGWLVAEVYRRVPVQVLAWTVLVCLSSALPIGFAQFEAYGNPLVGRAAIVWILFGVAGVRMLLCLRRDCSTWSGLALVPWWLTWPTLLSLQAAWLGGRFGLAPGWTAALLVLPWIASAALSLWRAHWLAWPFDVAAARYQAALRFAIFSVLGVWWFVALANAGASAPLPWLPVLNPLDLTQVACLLLTVAWLAPMQARGHTIIGTRAALALAVLALLSVITLRTDHHWGGIEWDGALLSSSLAQTSLALLWSVLGVAGWVVGSRREQWWLWLAGALLMGVVLVKLLLVDRANLGDLLGIGAFIGYGLLCTFLGWLAPVPPRRGPDARAGA